MLTSRETIGDYLVRRLREHGARHVFGVPGDYVLGFYDQILKGGLDLVNTCDEPGAGFAADAYARLHGLGVVCVTYCVGGLKIANTTAQAYAERSPVVVLSGAPGMTERARNLLLHHRVRSFDTQHRVFEQLTVASAVLQDRDTACQEIDRVLEAAIRYKQPVYLELPRDMVHLPARALHHTSEPAPISNPDSLREALNDALECLRRAKQPVILAGELLHRFGLQESLVHLVERTRIPVASTLLSKSVIEEDHPLYLGVYAGALGRNEVRQYVEDSDCLVMLGAMLTDMTLGIYTATLDPRRCINVGTSKVAVAYRNYEEVLLADFLTGLLTEATPQTEPSLPVPPATERFVPRENAPVTVARLFQCLNGFVDEQTLVLADPGDALLGGMELVIDRDCQFISPSYYASLGFAIPGALGAQLAMPDVRPLALVGDGSFQMSGHELSTIVRRGLNPIVVVLNNGGYATERPMLDGPFNDVLNWRYSRLPEVFGSGRGFEVRTETELVDALQAARGDTTQFSILDVILPAGDLSPGLQRLTQALAKQVR